MARQFTWQVVGNAVFWTVFIGAVGLLVATVVAGWPTAGIILLIFAAAIGFAVFVAWAVHHD